MKVMKLKIYKDKNIVFYDGDCGLCHRSLRYIIKRDHNRCFYFAPLQGQIAKDTLSKSHLQLDNMIVLTSKNKILTGAQGWIYIMLELRGLNRLIGKTCSFLPNFILEFTYNFIAKHRKKIFATPSSHCPILTDDLKPYFLN